MLLSFYANDLVDNVRTGLFVLEDGQLKQTADAYVPAGGLGNFLNTNPIFNWLSGYSNAFVFAKERITLWLKRGMVSANENQVAGKISGETGEAEVAQRRLAAAILDRIYETTHSRGIPLVIQSIPHPVGAEKETLIEMFPLAEFDLDREGLIFVGLIDPLRPEIGKHPLYNRQSHGHWTALGHRISGETLARAITEAGHLGAPSGEVP